jgi:non-ribosomal peptide synthetase component E (peptide arylation enzyme)
MNIVEVIRSEAGDHLEGVAVIDGDRQISYRELFSAVDEVAVELRECVDNVVVLGERHLRRILRDYLV